MAALADILTPATEMARRLLQADAALLSDADLTATLTETLRALLSDHPCLGGLANTPVPTGGVPGNDGDAVVEALAHLAAVRLDARVAAGMAGGVSSLKAGSLSVSYTSRPAAATEDWRRAAMGALLRIPCIQAAGRSAIPPLFAVRGARRAAEEGRAP